MARDPLNRGEEFWTPEPIFTGATVFLLAGGPSLRDFDCGRLHGLRCLVINEAAKLLPDAEVLYFTDNGWWDLNRDLVLGWPGLVVTASRAAKKAAPDKLRRVNLDPRPDFAVGAGTVRRGRSSGHIAVAVAIAMNARRLVLLGYDMRHVDGRSHFHDRYTNPSAKLYSDDFIPAFDGWHAAALRAGVDVVNATPGSALLEFPMVDIASEIAMAHSAMLPQPA